MSRRGSASRPASRRTSISPTGNEPGSPTAPQYTAQPGSSDGRHDSASIGYSNGAYQSQQIPPRTLGVHTMLNPPDPRNMASEGVGFPGSRTAGNAPPGPLTGAYGAPQPYYASQPVSQSHPGTPVGSAMVHGGPLPQDRRPSPPSSYQYPTMHNPPRKILSPKMSRSSSISFGPSREPDPRQSPLVPASSPVKRPFEPEVAGDSRYLPGYRAQPRMPLSAASPMASPSRSISQPVMLQQPGGHRGQQTPGQHPSMQSPGLSPGPPPGPPRDMPGRPPPFHSQSQFQPGLPAARSYSISGPAGDRPSAWPEAPRQSGMGQQSTGDGQQDAMAMALPGGDVHIHVPIDYENASKKADEKRQRNAKASTRHRRKKKSMLEENEKHLQDLRDERQQMMQQMRDIAHERDFYQTERNRLRDVVARTPGIAEQAEGPTSPPSTRLDAFAETSPIGQSLGVATPSGYASESSSAERPAQRRRVDDRPEFSIPVYGTPTGGPAPPSLPPMQAQGYGMLSRPSSASSTASGERLPPLRAMDGPPPPGHSRGPGVAHEQDPRTGQWIPVQPRQYEMGFATPRHPQDAPPR